MISIIIIVKNDFRIRKLLDKLTTIKHPEKSEVIVVDASKGKLDKIRQDFPRITWLYFENKSNKNRTYPDQRNIGIKNAKGDIFVFIDADCLPQEDWLTHLLAPIYQEQEQFVSGAIRPLKKNDAHIEESYSKYRDECETMNMAVSKKLIDDVGLFDESMEGCEDSDFCIRARKKGYKIRFQPSAIVYHDWGGFIQNIRRSFNGGQDRISLYRKHPDILFTFSINNVYTFYYLFYVLFLPIALYYPFYLLILFIPSLIKRRNPIKEFYNVAFSFGALYKTVKYILNL